MKPLRTASGIFAWCLLATWAMATGPWLSDFEKARAEAQRLQRPLLIHFYSDSCVPCVKMEQTVLHTPPVNELLTHKIVAVSVNVDHHMELAKRFGIDRWPSDVIVEPETGRRLTTSTGPKPLGDYCTMIEKGIAWYRVPKPVPKPNPVPAPAPSVPQTPVYDAKNLLLDGYSPISLLKDKKWIKGEEKFAVQFEGMWYLLASAEEVKTFQTKPAKYAAQFLGCDPVLLWEAPQVPAIRGTTKFAAFYDDQLYLFSTKENRDTFKQTPDKYITTRVVLDLDLIETVIR